MYQNKFLKSEEIIVNPEISLNSSSSSSSQINININILLEKQLTCLF